MTTRKKVTIKTQPRKDRTYGRGILIVIVILIAAILLAIIMFIILWKKRRCLFHRTKNTHISYDHSSCTLPRDNELESEAVVDFTRGCKQPNKEDFYDTFYQKTSKNIQQAVGDHEITSVGPQNTPLGRISTRNEYHTTPEMLGNHKCQDLLYQNHDNGPRLITPFSNKPTTGLHFDPIHSVDTNLTISGMSSEEISNDRLVSPWTEHGRPNVPIVTRTYGVDPAISPRPISRPINRYRAVPSNDHRKINPYSDEVNQRVQCNKSRTQNINIDEDPALFYNTLFVKPSINECHRAKPQLMYANVCEGVDKLCKVDTATYLNDQYEKLHKNFINAASNIANLKRDGRISKNSTSNDNVDIKLISQLTNEIKMISNNIKAIEEKICTNNKQVRDVVTQLPNEGDHLTSTGTQVSIPIPSIFGANARNVDRMINPTYYHKDPNTGILNNPYQPNHYNSATLPPSSINNGFTVAPFIRLSMNDTNQQYHPNVGLDDRLTGTNGGLYNYPRVHPQMQYLYDQERINQDYRTLDRSVYPGANVDGTTLRPKSRNEHFVNEQMFDSPNGNNYRNISEKNVNAFNDIETEKDSLAEDTSEKKDRSKLDIISSSDMSYSGELPISQTSRDNIYSQEIPSSDSGTDFTVDIVDSKSGVPKKVPPTQILQQNFQHPGKHHWESGAKNKSNNPRSRGQGPVKQNLTICHIKRVPKKKKVCEHSVSRLEDNIRKLKRYIDDFVV